MLDACRRNYWGLSAEAAAAGACVELQAETLEG